MKPLHQILLFILLTLCVAFCISGCSDTGLLRWQQTRDVIRGELVAATQQVSELQREIDALPPGPIRDQAAAALARAKALAPELEARLQAIDQALNAARSGDVSALGAGIGGLLAGLPVVGPYAGLIGLLAGLGWGIYQRVKRASEVDDAVGSADQLRQHLENVVRSIDAAGPDWTEQDKAAIRAIQGEATTRVVEQIQAGT